MGKYANVLKLNEVKYKYTTHCCEEKIKFSNIVKHCQRLSNVVRRCQTLPNGVKSCQTVPNAVQIFSVCQMLPSSFAKSRLRSYWPDDEVRNELLLQVSHEPDCLPLIIRTSNHELRMHLRNARPKHARTVDSKNIGEEMEVRDNLKRIENRRLSPRI